MVAAIENLESRQLLTFVPTGASTINGTDFQSVDKIVPLPGGGYIAAGLFSSTTKFTGDTTLTALDNADVFLQYVNGTTHSTLAIGSDSGNRLKFKDDRVDFASEPRRVDDSSFPFGVSAVARRGDEYVSQIKIGPDGKLYVALVFKNDISLNTQDSKARVLSPDDSYEKNFFDSAILRYSISGGKFVLEDVKQIGGPFNDIIDDFTFDNTGNLLVAGSFERGCDFDPTSRKAIYNPNGRSDAFVAKYYRSGKLSWVSQFGSDTTIQPELEAAFSIAAAPSDDALYIGGSFAGRADFARNGGTPQKKVAEADKDTDGYTMRLDSSGNLDWVRVQGGSDYDGVKAVTVAPDGGVYNVGYFQKDADLDPTSNEQIFTANDRGRNSEDPTDLFFTRFDADGNVVRVKALSGDGYELIAGASTNANGDLVIAGSYAGKAWDVDPSSRTRILTSPDSDNNDPNQDKRDNAYAGFVLTYSSTAKLKGIQQVVGQDNQDVFITGAAMAANGNLAIGGRYRGGFSVIGTAVRVGTNTDFHNYREDGFSLVFNAGLETIA